MFKTESFKHVAHILRRQMSKRQREGGQGASKRATKKPKTRKGFQSVARTRGAQVQGEMKYFDTEKSISAIVETNDWTGTEQDPTTFNTLFVPVVGAGINQRIGKSAKILKLKMRFLVDAPQQTNQTLTDPAADIRLIVYLDKQTNAAQAQGEQVMTGGVSDGTGILSFQNIDNFGRFQVLMDKSITLQNPNVSWDGTNIEQQGVAKMFKWSKNFKKPIVVRFNATNGGTVADIVDNSLHVIALTDNDDLAPRLSYYSRVCFKE